MSVSALYHFSFVYLGAAPILYVQVHGHVDPAPSLHKKYYAHFSIVLCSTTVREKVMENTLPK